MQTLSDDYIIDVLKNKKGSKEYDVVVKFLIEGIKNNQCIILPCKKGDNYYVVVPVCESENNGFIANKINCEDCSCGICNKVYKVEKHKIWSTDWIIKNIKYIGNIYLLSESEAQEKAKKLNALLNEKEHKNA